MQQKSDNVVSHYVFEAPVRIWHWLTVLCMAVLMVTGYFIGKPLPSVSGEATYLFYMGYIRLIHFSAGMIFTVVLLMRIYWAFVGNHYSRELFIVPVWRKSWWQGVWYEIRWYLFLAKRPSADIGHNPIAQAAMFGYFLMSVFMIITGFALYSEHSQYAIFAPFRYVVEFFYWTEGFGVRVAERLYAHYHWPEYVEIVDGGTQGLNLLGYVESAGHLLILDAIDYGLEPGTLRTYAGERIPAYLSAKKMSLHQNSFSEVLALADIRGHLPAHIALVGLQPAMLDDYGGSLSELAREQLPAAEQAALVQLAAWGIVPQPTEELRCLNYDCLSMENYEGVRLRQYRMRLEEQG